MHLLQWDTLVYFLLQLIGFLLCFSTMFGIPGEMDNTKPLIKKVSNTLTLLMNISLVGIPVCFVGSIYAFYVTWTFLGKTLATISFSLGLATFLCLITLYKIKD